MKLEPGLSEAEDGAEVDDDAGFLNGRPRLTLGQRSFVSGLRLRGEDLHRQGTTQLNISPQQGTAAFGPTGTRRLEQETQSEPGALEATQSKPGDLAFSGETKQRRQGTFDPTQSEASLPPSFWERRRLADLPFMPSPRQQRSIGPSVARARSLPLQSLLMQPKLPSLSRAPPMSSPSLPVPIEPHQPTSIGSLVASYGNHGECMACTRVAQRPLVLVCSCRREHAICANHLDWFWQDLQDQKRHRQEEDEDDDNDGVSITKRARYNKELRSSSALSYSDGVPEANLEISVAEVSTYFDAKSVLREGQEELVTNTTPNVNVAHSITRSPQVPGALPLTPPQNRSQENVPTGPSITSPLSIAASDLFDIFSWTSAQPRDWSVGTPSSPPPTQPILGQRTGNQEAGDNGVEEGGLAPVEEAVDVDSDAEQGERVAAIQVVYSDSDNDVSMSSA